MADLLYHIKNFFTLVDGDNNELDIKEPINWDKILINIEFKNATNTYSTEFTDKDVSLEFDLAAGKEFIENVYDTKGVDGILLLNFGQINPDGSREILYTGQANFSNYIKSTESGKRVVSLNMERKSLGDNFMNRYSIKTNLNLANSLSGVPMPLLNSVNVRLHTKLLKVNTQYRWDEKSDPDFPRLVPVSDDNGSGFFYKTLAPPIIFNGDNNISNLQEPIEPDGQLIYAGLTLPAGMVRRVLTFNWNFNAIFTIYEDQPEETSGLPNLLGGGAIGFKIYKKKNISTTGTASMTDGLIDTNYGVEIPYPLGIIAWPFAIETNLSSTGSGKIELDGDDAIFIKFYFKTNRSLDIGMSTFLGFYYITFLGINSFVFSVDEVINFAPTLARAHNLFDAVNQQVGLITDLPNSLKSNYLKRGIGCLGNRLILSGKMVRGFFDFDSGVVLSAQDWYQSINALTPIGMNIERDNNGNQFLRVEDIAYYFANVKLLTIAIIDLNSYEKSCDQSVIYNQIIAGTAKAPQSGQSNSLGDWLGSFTFITPILRVANALNIVTQFIIDSFYIELARREQKTFDPTVTYETDKDNYLLHDTNVSRSSAVVGGVVFDATNKKIYFPSVNSGICLNDLITITGTASNNKILTVLNFEEDSSFGTVIFVQEAIVNETVSGSTTFTYAPRYDCKKNEDFDHVDGIYSPETAYNLIHHVVRMVIASAKVWRSGMTEKPLDSKISYTGGANNSGLGTVLKQSVPCRFGDGSPDGFFIYDGGNGNSTSLQYLDQPLWTKNVIKFKCQLTWEIIKLVRLAFEGRHPDDKNYGYIEITNPDGELETGWILSMKFQPVTLTVIFQLRERYNG